ncbi:MAG: hypothetical protein KKB59_14160 [Spirochaetes bacterium]|nr:hypothetical protein [Spirochaetota bacterium]
MDPRLMIRYAPDDGGGGGEPPAVEPATPPAEPAGPPTWLTQVSPDRRDKKELHKYAKLNDLVDAHIGMEAKLARAVVIPDPKTATPEDMAAFKRTMGIPEKPEDYTFNADAYKGAPNIDKLTEASRTLAVTAGLTKGQAGKVFDFVAGLVKTGTDAQTQAKAETQKTFPARLLETVGGDAKKAEEVTNRLTKFMATEIGDAELVKEIADSGLLFNPRFAAKIAVLSAKLDDSPYVDGKETTSPKGPGQFGGNYSDDFNRQFGGNK